MASAASIFARKNLNQILGYFQRTIATYSLDEFKTHFCSQRATCEIVVGRSRLREIYLLETHSEDLLSTKETNFNLPLVYGESGERRSCC